MQQVRLVVMVSVRAEEACGMASQEVRFSNSVVTNFLTWSGAILEEAVDQDFIWKNPARKLISPQTRHENKRFLELHEIPPVLSKMSFREEALILRMTLVLGLRPGELLALRWDDVQGYALRLDESTIDGKLYSTLKAKQSSGFVALPASIRSGLAAW
jgi:hypothetical protein